MVFLHIGAMKTGTTFLQGLMLANREHLAAAGYLFPGHTWGRQVRAVQDMIGRTAGDRAIRAEAVGAWEGLVREILDHRGVASIVSMELLSFATAGEARAIVTSLAPAEVHVVLALRDATATIPAQWQTNVQNGSTVGWPAFMKGVRRAGRVGGGLGRYSFNPSLRSFSRSQDAAYMLRSWSRAVPPSSIHVITVPPIGSEPRLLWERFAWVLGIDPSVCSEPTALTNESLGYPSAELLRRLNKELGRIRPIDYDPTVKEFLAGRVLSRRIGHEYRARVDRATREFGLAWNQRSRRAIAGARPQLIGHLQDLPIALSRSCAVDTDEVQAVPSDAELLPAAVAAIAAMRRLIGRRAKRVQRRGLSVDLVLAEEVASAPQAWSSSEAPVTAAVAEIAGLARTAIMLERRLREMNVAESAGDQRRRQLATRWRRRSQSAHG